jgi:P-type conjugative transfer protein TrbJ
MKKFKKLFITLALVIFTTNICAKSISIKGITEILKVVTKIYTQQQLMGTEQIQQGMSLINQIENQVRQIENQYTMLKNLSTQISQGNIAYIEDYYRELGYMLDSYNSVMLDTEKLSSKYMDAFNTNTDEFENMGFTREYMERMDQNIRQARQESNTALYDVMTSKGFAAKVGADQQNLQTLLNASKSSTGIVEALQVTNSLLGQISSDISQLGVLVETSNKAQAMATNTESQELENSKRELDQLKERQEFLDNKKMLELKNKAGKSVSI